MRRTTPGRPMRRLTGAVATKIALGPVLGIAVIVLLIVISLSGIGRMRATLVSLHDGSAVEVVRGERAATGLLTLQSTLFQYTTWLDLHGDPQVVARMRDTIDTTIGRLAIVAVEDPQLLAPQSVESLRGQVRMTTLLLAKNTTLGFSNCVSLEHTIARIRDDVAAKLEARKHKADLAYSQALGAASRLLVVLSGAGAVAVVSLVLCILFVSRVLVRGMTRLTTSIMRLASGDASALAAPIPGVERADEIGDIARAVVVFRDGLTRARQADQEKAAAAEAEHDRSVRLDAAVKGFEATIGDMAARLVSGSRQMTQAAQAMSTLAADSREAATAVSSSAAAASARLETVSEATGQLNAATDEISRRTAEAAAATQRAATDTGDTDGMVRALEESAARIGQVVDVITDIATQTNLLALNATIEAARAGDLGKGFAVVASEVRVLASRTAKATGDIGAQIGQIQSATRSVVQAIGGVSRSVESIAMIAGSIAAAVEQQSASTQEIFRNVTETAGSARQVTSSASVISGASGKTGTAAQNVLTAATDVTGQADLLSAEVERFIRQVRAA